MTRGLLAIIALFLSLSIVSSVAYMPQVPVAREPHIVLPSYLLPAVAKPGDEVKIYLRGPAVQLSEALIINPQGSYKLQIADAGTERLFVDPTYEMSLRVARITIPKDARAGLYNLIVTYSGGMTFMPNAIIIDPQGGPRGSIRIAHLTDLHFGAEEGGMGNNMKHTRHIPLLNTLVERFGVQLVVYTGDLVDVGSDLLSYRELFSSLSQVSAPQLAITGNHDWSQVDNTRTLVEMYYGRYVVPFRVWNFSYGDFMFVAIDTRLEGFPEPWQLDWLERTLAGTRRASIILMHHPFFNREGEYVGTAESLRSEIYRSWREAFDVAKRFLEIVNKNKHVVAVLAGHVHRNADAIYYREDGSRVYFITTATANHGLPAGHFWSTKVIDIKASGEVSIIIPSGRRYEPTAGAINTASFRVFEIKDRSSTAVSWFWNVSGFTDMSVDSIILPFYLNATIPLEAYKIYDPFGAVKRVERYNLITHHLIKVEADLRRPGKITVTSYEDRERPEIRVVSPISPSLFMPMSIELQITERGWGIERVTARVFLNDRHVSTLNAIRSNNPEQFRFVLVPREEGVYKIVIEAVDLAGNVGQQEITFALGSAETRTATPTPSPTPTAAATTPVATTAPTTIAETATLNVTSSPERVPTTANAATTTEGREGMSMELIIIVAALIALAALLLLRRK